MLQIVYQIFSEIILIICYPIFSFLVNFIPRSELHGTGRGPTIVIVERWLSINIQHIFWKYYLERKGFDVYLANFPLRIGDFRDSARLLDKYIQRHDLKEITLVGISSGAITSLLYLQERDGWNRVDKFVSIGAPFKGSWAAVFLLWAKSGRELLPSSSLMQEINSMKIISPSKIHCIRARFDEMVPYGSCFPGARETVIHVIGHNNLHIRVRGTYKKIMQLA